MADNKKYYYLKLKDNFFDSDEMVVLESMPDGHLYSNILLKLYLRSLKHEGKLMFNERIPFNSTMLAQITRHNVGTVEKAVKIFSQLGLIEIMDNGAIYMLDIQNFIGESSTEADRKRVYRKKIDDEKQSLLLNGQMSGQTSDKSTPEIEIDKEREKEKEKEYSERKIAKRIKENEIKKNFLFPDYLNEKSIEIVKKGNPMNYEKRIPIAYLNQKTGKNYQYVEKNTKLIENRFKEGFTLDDFKIVIDWKIEDWLGTDMQKYLRPETLFGNKFDGYLNEKPIVSKQPSFKNISSADEPDWSEIYGKDL